VISGVAVGTGCVGSGWVVGAGADVGERVGAGAAQATSNPAISKTNHVDLIICNIFFSFENWPFYD
jgi:hypothetical protein